MKAAKPANEAQRLAALKEYHILDTGSEQAYDDLTTLVAQICHVPIAVISLVDESRQWFKAKLGVRQQETSREVAFCAHAILQPEPLIVPDALKDSRFANSQLVQKAPHIRFYAGFPLINPEGLSLGTVCAIDRKPRRLSTSQTKAMQALSRLAMARLELRRVSSQLAEALERVTVLHELLPMCAWCKRIRDDQGYWTQVEAYLAVHSHTQVTSGICPECFQKLSQQTSTKIGLKQRSDARRKREK